MAYTNLRTAHSVGDVVYIYDTDTDSVVRAVVTSICATTESPGSEPQYQVNYTVRRKWAQKPDQPLDGWALSGEFLHSDVQRAFPPVPPDAEPAPQDEPAAVYALS